MLDAFLDWTHVLKQGENLFATIAGPGRMPDIYIPGVQVLIRYKNKQINKGDFYKLIHWYSNKYVYICENKTQ